MPMKRFIIDIDMNSLDFPTIREVMEIFEGIEKLAEEKILKFGIVGEGKPIVEEQSVLPLPVIPVAETTADRIPTTTVAEKQKKQKSNVLPRIYPQTRAVLATMLSLNTPYSIVDLAIMMKMGRDTMAGNVRILVKHGLIMHYGTKPNVDGRQGNVKLWMTSATARTAATTTSGAKMISSPSSATI